MKTTREDMWFALKGCHSLGVPVVAPFQSLVP